MNFEGAIFVGVARPVPDVLDFVTPVFTTKDGSSVAQRVSDGRIATFEPIEVGAEFLALSLPRFMQVGDPALYAVELQNGVSIGPLKSIASTLISMSSGVARRLEALLRRQLHSSTHMCAGELLSVVCHASASFDPQPNLRELVMNAVDAARAWAARKDRDDDPLGWALAHRNLAGSLFNDFQATAATATIERCTEALDSALRALEIYKRDEYPLDWAVTQHNLGLALRQRSHLTGDPEHFGAMVGGSASVLDEAIRVHRSFDWSPVHSRVTTLRGALRSLPSRLRKSDFRFLVSCDVAGADPVRRYCDHPTSRFLTDSISSKLGAKKRPNRRSASAAKANLATVPQEYSTPVRDCGQMNMMDPNRALEDSKPPHESVESLYARFYGELKSYIQRYASITQSTEDLVHDVYVRLLIHPGRSEIRDPKAFLYWLANCVMATEARKVRKARRLTVSLNAEESEENVTPYPHLWMVDDSSEDADQAELKRAIDALPEYQRQVFILQRFGGHKIAAISQLTGINPNTVKKYLLQAKTQLMKFYGVDARREK